MNCVIIHASKRANLFLSKLRRHSICPCNVKRINISSIEKIKAKKENLIENRNITFFAIDTIKVDDTNAN